MPPKGKSGIDTLPTSPPAQSLVTSLFSSGPTKIEPEIPLPIEPYDEQTQLQAPRGVELRALLEEDERLTAEYTGELARLQSELNRKTKDTTQMVKYLEAEVRRKDLMSKRMNKQLLDLHENHSQDLTMMFKQFENTGKYMEKIFMEKEKQILEKNSLLQTQIHDLSSFQIMRTQLANELEQTKAIIFKNERQHKLQLDELEKNFLAARDGLQREAASRIANSRATYKNEVGRELEEESTAVRLENEKLRERLRTHEATSDRLQKQHSTLTKSILFLKQDLELRTQQNEEYLKKALKQTKSIDTLTQQTKKLEEELLTRLREKESKQLRLTQEAQERIVPLEARLIEVKQQAEEIDSIHRKLKRKAKLLLQGKKNTTQFFLTALSDTRASIARKQELQSRERDLLQQSKLRELTLPVSLRMKLPVIHQTSGTAVGQDSTQSSYNNGNIFSSPLDLTDLTLSDREKVLRLLYAKISHVPSGLTVQLPPHSFDIQMGTGEIQGGSTLPLGSQLQDRPRSLPPGSHHTNEFAVSPSSQLLLSGSSDGPIDPSSSSFPSKPEYDMTFLTNMDAGAGEDDDGDGSDEDDEQPWSNRDQSQRFQASSQAKRPISAADETD